MVDFWYTITYLGEAELWSGIFIVLILAYLFLRYKRSNTNMKIIKNFIIVGLISLLIGFVLVTALKDGLAIPRPCVPCSVDVDCNEYCPESFAFPSGHATIIFTVVTSLLLTAKKKWVLPLYLVALLVAVSRIILGVHYIGDVIGGAALGTALPIATWHLLKTRLKL